MNIHYSVLGRLPCSEVNWFNNVNFAMFSHFKWIWRNSNINIELETAKVCKTIGQFLAAYERAWLTD